MMPFPGQCDPVKAFRFVMHKAAGNVGSPFANASFSCLWAVFRGDFFCGQVY